MVRFSSSAQEKYFEKKKVIKKLKLKSAVLPWLVIMELLVAVIKEGNSEERHDKDDDDDHDDRNVRWLQRLAKHLEGEAHPQVAMRKLGIQHLDRFALHKIYGG